MAINNTDKSYIPYKIGLQFMDEIEPTTFVSEGELLLELSNLKSYFYKNYEKTKFCPHISYQRIEIALIDDENKKLFKDTEEE